ncbi:hypothetical protein ACH5RR_029964 [Cinchona calisaya]|uniref:DUF4283 domain-containing protein n=1 Tax=Cinchona calisaya TaxID=153742 RepID=A0ABD2YUG1_9GENT
MRRLLNLKEVPWMKFHLSSFLWKTRLESISLLNRLFAKGVGKIVDFKFFDLKIREIWKPKESINIINLGKDFFPVKFLDEDDFLTIISRGPWFLNRYYVSIRLLESNFSPYQAQQSKTAIWAIQYEDVSFCFSSGLIGRSLDIRNVKSISNTSDPTFKEIFTQVPTVQGPCSKENLGPWMMVSSRRKNSKPYNNDVARQPQKQQQNGHEAPQTSHGRLNTILMQKISKAESSSHQNGNSKSIGKPPTPIASQNLGAAKQTSPKEKSFDLLDPSCSLHPSTSNLCPVNLHPSNPNILTVKRKGNGKKQHLKLTLK